MATTNEASETLASTVFLNEHTLQSFTINAYDLLKGNVEYIRSFDSEQEMTGVQRGDYSRYKGDMVIPESFKTMDLHILVLKNEMVVIGFSDLARVEEYDSALGKDHALVNAIDRAYAVIAADVKESRAESPLVDKIATLANELIPSAVLLMGDPIIGVYPMNLGHALGYLFGVENINHTLKDVTVSLAVIQSNGFNSFGYHQASNHETFDEASCRTMAGVEAVMHLKNARLTIAKTAQMKQLEA